MCDSLGIKHRQITVGNSRANGQAERTIRTIKEVIRRMMTEQEHTFWSDHLPAALMTLRFTAHRLLGMPPFVIVTGRTAVPPSHLLEEVDLGEIAQEVD